MSELSINDFLTEDHDRLDNLLEQFEKCRETDLAQATDFLAQFTAGLHRHLGWEEGILFPLFEKKTGKTGLTNTLRGEHDEIREWLKLLTEKVEHNDRACDHEAKMLVEELGGHNAREEYALYPELDKLLSEAEIRQTMKAMMKGRFADQVKSVNFVAVASKPESAELCRWQSIHFVSRFVLMTLLFPAPCHASPSTSISSSNAIAFRSDSVM